jgi:C4-dicarboxylate-specific signal transduction histidine kinase
MRTSALRWVWTALLVGAALGLVLLLQPYLPYPFLFPLLAAVVVGGWFGGPGPGLFAVVLSTLAVDYFFIPPLRAFSIYVDSIPYLATFVVSALLAAWLSAARRKAEASLRLARDQLEARVEERTVELHGANQALRAEIAERMRAEEGLRKTRAELEHVTRVLTMGEIVASIAHEINQPLAGVVTNAGACLRWLDGEAPNLDEARDAARRIVRDGTRAGDVITQLRGLLKKTEPEKARLDVNHVIEDAITLVQREARTHEVSLAFEPAAGLPAVTADRIQLQQVVLNLALNAIEAMSASPGPRSLRISTCRREPDEVEVAVEDSGPGIAAADLERIFDAFFTTKAGGLGMGLSISRSIVDGHGGRLRAIHLPGGGARFSFTLPASSAA